MNANLRVIAPSHKSEDVAAKEEELKSRCVELRSQRRQARNLKKRGAQLERTPCNIWLLDYYLSGALQRDLGLGPSHTCTRLRSRT